MKKIISLLVASMFALSSNAFTKDFGNATVDLELGYAFDGISQDGTDYNSARPSTYLSLDLFYNLNDNVKFGLENAAFEYEDDTASDGTANYDIYSELSVEFKTGSIDIRPYAYVTTQDDSGNQGDSTDGYGIELGNTFSNGVRAYVGYSEAGNKFKTDGGVEYATEALIAGLEKTYDKGILGFGKETTVELLYADYDNLRKVYSLDVELMINDSFGIGVTGVENDGQGTFANVDSQNRDHIAGRVFVKY